MSFEETIKSSTWRELTAVLFSLKSFLPKIKSRRVILKVDNYAASRIVHVGSRIHELHSIALEIDSICRENGILLQVSWIPRILNADADKLSKYTDVGDWQITPIFFAFLNSKWGPFTKDRFANSQNRKLQRFNSKFFCPGSEAVDAFLQNWECENNLLVPPVEDIPKVVRYITERKVRGTMVIPFWESAVYWPMLCAENNTFRYFVKDYMIFRDMDNVIIPGSCPFSVIGLTCMKGGIIVLKIES